MDFPPLDAHSMSGVARQTNESYAAARTEESSTNATNACGGVGMYATAAGCFAEFQSIDSEESLNDSFAQLNR